MELGALLLFSGDHARCDRRTTARAARRGDGNVAGGTIRDEGRWQVFDLEPTLFEKVPEISIDFGVMERARNVGVIRATFDWSDIGSWSAIHTRDR